VKSLWNDAEASQYVGELAQRIYTSRLLGRETDLVLHGGGNTSVKVQERDILGNEETILYVKGSGGDLARIDEGGFAPVRMARLLGLARLKSLSDPQMVNELRTHLTRASAPTPSIEALLHAILPHRYVDHTHADAVVTVTNSPDGASRVREIYGDEVVIIPYVMPGFDLARACAERLAAEAGPRTVGMVLMNHGIFSFGSTARESYERMIALVTSAEEYLARRGAWGLPERRAENAGREEAPRRREIASLRKAVSAVAGFPLVLAVHDDARSRAFARRDDLPSLARGPATPDHVIRTKRLPMIGRDVEGYAAKYREVFERQAPAMGERVTMLDAAPRVILDPDLGLCAVGRGAKDAAIVFDIYAHTMDIIERATLLGGYQPLPEHELFCVEYWDLEQAKLRASGRPPALAGEIALVTGAASGIGKATVESMLARGAAVVGLDLSPEVEGLHLRPDYLGIVGDVTRLDDVVRALERAARAFGGLDVLVLNAGVFPGGKRIDSLSDEEWRRVLGVNVDANMGLLREAYPLLAMAPRGGRVVVIGSKNVPAPGPGAAAYSASKAALTQLARVAALEWAASGIRVNTLHPDAVFDTGIWTPEVLAARAQSYGMTVADYKTKNLLHTEVRSTDVAELAAELCGPLFAKTTGAQIPIDGGNDRVI